MPSTQRSNVKRRSTRTSSWLKVALRAEPGGPFSRV